MENAEQEVRSLLSQIRLYKAALNFDGVNKCKTRLNEIIINDEIGYWKLKEIEHELNEKAKFNIEYKSCAGRKKK